MIEKDKPAALLRLSPESLPLLFTKFTHSLSLRARMMLLFTSVVAVLLLLSYFAFYALLARNVRIQIDAQLLKAASPIAQHLMSKKDNKYGDIRELDLAGVYFEVIDSLGNVEVTSRNLERPLAISRQWLDPAGPAYYTMNAGAEGVLRMVVVPYRHRGDWRFLAVSMPSQDADHVLDSFRRMILWTFPLSLFLIALVSNWYAGRSLRPISELTDHAARMADHLSNHSGRPMAPLVIMNPNDEVGRLAETFNRLAARVTTVVRQLRQFVSDASHEMRTPLTILQGETELTLAEERSPEEYQRTLTVIDDELKKLSHIVQGLFTLSMADAGELRLAKEPLYINEVLEETCSLVSPLAESKKIMIERSIGQEVAFDGDEAFLRQLFMIFLDNSIKYSPPETRIQVGMSRVNGSVDITFRDQGIGIPQEDLTRIFERFYRAPSANAAEANSGGLGLAIAQAIVGAHGGSINCASKAGSWSTFTVHLPLHGVPDRKPVGIET